MKGLLGQGMENGRELARSFRLKCILKLELLDSSLLSSACVRKDAGSLATSTSYIVNVGVKHDVTFKLFCCFTWI